MLLAEFNLPLADFEDWGRAIVPLIVIIFWVLQQVFGGDNKKKQAPPRRVKRPAQPGEEAPAAEADIQAELQDFLREAAGRKRKDEPRMVRPTAVDEVVEAEVIESEPPPRMRPPAEHSSVRDMVPPVDQPMFPDHNSHLGDEVALADDKVDARMHEVFDHDVGRMDDYASSDQHSHDDLPIAIPKKAKEIRALLREPSSVRNAVIMNEILSRPEDRW